MPYAGGYGPPIIDWGGMSNIVQQFREGQEHGRENAMRSEMRGLDPSAPDYFDQAIAVMNKYKPELAGQWALAKAARDETAAYHAQSLVPEDVRLLQYWQKNGGAGAPPSAPTNSNDAPMYLGPSESSIGGDYAAAAQNMPGSIQSKLLPMQEQERLKQEGKNKADQARATALAGTISKKVQSVLDKLDANVKGVENATFENALGPFQGLPDAESWQGAVGQFLPQTAGAVMNWVDKVRNSAPAWSLNRDWKGNTGQTTSEVRAMIHGTTATLTNLLKPLIRVKGEGAQSDRDMLVIQQQVGELAKSKTKEEFYRRLGVVVGNLNGLGLNVNIPDAPAMDMATEPPPAAEVAPPTQPNELPVYSQPPQASEAAVADPRGAYFGGGMNRQAAPENTIINNGKQRLIKQGGKWIPLQ